MIKRKIVRQPVSTNIDPNIIGPIRKYCKKTGNKLYRFIENALIRELKARRNGETL